MFSMFIDLSYDQLIFYLFAVILDRCNGSRNTFDMIYDKLCVLNKTEDLNIKYLIWKQK